MSCINLTAGMGGDLVLGGEDSPLPPDPGGTDMAGAAERLEHVAELRPEICTLDCGTMNFAAGGDYVMVNTPSMLRAMAARIRDLGVRPELEVFDTGHLVFVDELIRDGLIDGPPMIQLCTGIPYGAPDDPATLLAMVNRLPQDAVFSAFSIGRMQLPFVALAPLLGGNVRVGLEDNLYLSRGRLATNAELVARAVSILRGDERQRARAGGGAREARARAAWLNRPRTVGLLGGGVIGGGWAARFLLNGVDVRLHDPAPGAERGVAQALENARRAYGRLTLAPLPAEGSLVFAGSVEEAVAGADFVQESAPERLELKRELLAAADRAAPAGAVICSSTSGLRPTELQAGLARPERLVVGHPFNPVYLLPLVEVCGGRQTDAATVERAAAVYRSVGMHPLHVRTEIDGFVADRLLEALWREALWLVHDDVATVAEIDDAIRYGAGLRWAYMGTFLTYRIAGGDAGMRHFLSQFGPALAWPWTKLMDVPELSEDLIDKLAAQSDDQADGRSVRELERGRDDALVALLQALRAHEDRRRRDAGRLGARFARPGGRRGGSGRAYRCTPAAHNARSGGLDRLQRPRPREPLSAGLRRRDGRAPRLDRDRRGLPGLRRELLHRRDAPLTPSATRGGRCRHRDDPGARRRREAAAPLPRPAP